jgi:hypothetical protein
MYNYFIIFKDLMPVIARLYTPSLRGVKRRGSLMPLGKKPYEIATLSARNNGAKTRQ